LPVTVQIGPGLFSTRADLLKAYQAPEATGVVRSVGQQPRTMAGCIRVNVVRLDLTEAGCKLLRDGRLCYGRSEVVKAIDDTPAKAPDGTQLGPVNAWIAHA
jgi:hypothetical protein